MPDSNDMYSKCLTMLKFVLLYLFINKEINSISRRLPFRSLFKFKYLDIVYMSVRMLHFSFSNVYYLYTCMYCNIFLNKYFLNQSNIIIARVKPSLTGVMPSLLQLGHQMFMSKSNAMVNTIINRSNAIIILSQDIINLSKTP